MILPHPAYKKKESVVTKIKKPKLLTILPAELRNLKKVNVQTLKHRLNEYLTSVLDELIVDRYHERQGSDSNFMTHQILRRVKDNNIVEVKYLS